MEESSLGVLFFYHITNYTFRQRKGGSMELLEDYRIEIDKIDREITKLLEKRMNVSKAISKYKMENNMQIFHPDREKMVIEKNKGYL